MGEFKRSYKNARRHAVTLRLDLRTQLVQQTLSMPSQPQFVVPLAGTPRPPLPLEHLNPHIKSRQYYHFLSWTGMFLTSVHS